MIDTPILLLICLVMFLLGIYIARKYDLKYLFAMTGLLWFVPAFEIENTIIKIFSIIMFLTTIIIAFFTDRESEY